MDALAGYGSDDSSSSASSSAGRKEDQAAAPPLEKPGHPPIKKPKVGAKLSTDSDAACTTSKPGIQLSRPPLSKDEKDPWIYWKVNYLHRPLGKDQRHSAFSLGDDAPSSRDLQENLRRLSHKDNHAVDAADLKNWADRLRSQHEFHNPHFFASVVEHFGIQDPLGSAIRTADATTTGIRDHERILFPAVTCEKTDASTISETAPGAT